MRNPHNYARQYQAETCNEATEIEQCIGGDDSSPRAECEQRQGNADTGGNAESIVAGGL